MLSEVAMAVSRKLKTAALGSASLLLLASLGGCGHNGFSAGAGLGGGLAAASSGAPRPEDGAGLVRNTVATTGAVADSTGATQGQVQAALQPTAASADGVVADAATTADDTLATAGNALLPGATLDGAVQQADGTLNPAARV